MKNVSILLACLFVLTACGDEEENNPNSIVSPDFGQSDMASDMESDVGSDMDMGLQDMEPDMEEGPQPTVIVDPAEVTIRPNRAAILEAAYFDPEGMEVLDVDYAWSSEDELIATVDEFGGVLGVAAGYAKIYAAATTDGTQGEALVNVHTANSAVSVGRAHSCSSKVDNRVTCWGDNSLGQLAQPDMTPPSHSPIRLDIFIEDALPVGVAAGSDHTCTFDTLGRAFCWGRNNRGQIGNGNTETVRTPVQNSFESPINALAVGDAFTCAQLETGDLRCWGDNSGRALADSDTGFFVDAVSVHGGRDWSKVVAGTSHICALEGTDVWCWGSDDSSQLGPNGAGSSYAPVQVPGLFVDVFAGKDMSCAHDFNDKLLCWGAAPGGLGDGLSTESATPVDVAFPNDGVSAVEMGLNHTCAVADQVTYCWGENDRGQLGDDTLVTSATPVVVLNGSGLYDLSLGNKHSCGRSQRGDIFCWGSNVAGQLGDGTGLDSRTAVYVIPTAN